MTCSTMLDQMLEADLEELSGRGETALARHVQGCARCRAIASQLMRDTADLARTLPLASTRSLATREHRGLSRRAQRAVLAGVAAALSIVATREGQRVGAPPRVASVVMQPVRVSAPAPLPLLASDRRHPNRAARVVHAGRATRALAQRAAPTQSIVSVAVRVDPTLAAPAERAVSVAPVRLDPVASILPLGNGVSVDPPAGKRANIIRTDHPGVTVVWLYD